MHDICKICLLLAFSLRLALGLAIADEVTPKADQPSSSVELDDRAEPLLPLRPRSSRDDDRVRALGLFAAGRVAEQKQDYARALRDYERAFRYDPEALPALREIVPLAFNLDRQAEAVRYALLMAERDPRDPALLRRLANYLTEEGDTVRALRLYEKALALENREKPSASLVLLWLEMGRLYFLNKQYDQSAHHFSEVQKALASPKEYGLDATMQKALLGKPELSYQLFGESLLEAGRAAEALAAFRKSDEAKAEPALITFNEARVLARQKQPQQALTRLDGYFEKHFASQGTAPFLLLADLLKELGQSDQFIAKLEKLHTADPDNMPLAYLLAQRLQESGELDKAEPIYAGLLERHAARPPVEAFQGLVEIYRKKKNVEKLLTTLGEAVGRTGKLDALGESGKALVADSEMSKALLAAARQQQDASPDKLTYGSRLAAALLAIELKDFATANLFFDLAMKADPKKAGETLVSWGLELFMANQYADAIPVFQRGLEEKALPENNPSLYFYLAGALEMSGRTDEAIVAAKKAGELQKETARFQSRAPWIEYHAKRYDAARAGYLAVIEKFDKTHDVPDTRDTLRDARLVLSNISVLEGKLTESEEWLEQVLDEFPEDVGALNDLGYMWADSGKHLERALQMVQTAVAHEPKNMAYRDSLGWALFRLGRTADAVTELKAAAAVEEPDGLILDHLAEALQKSGDAAGAIDAWQRALQSLEKQADQGKAKEIREKLLRAQGAPAEK